MYKITILIALFFTSLHVNALELKLVRKNSISIDQDGVVRIIKLDTIINGYNVNCNGSKLIVWGKSKIINEGNPQDTNVVLVNLAGNYEKFQKAVSQGVFDIEYLKSNNYAYIGSNQGVLMNLSSGKLKGIDVDFDPENDENFESCSKNKSWSFNRFP